MVVVNVYDVINTETPGTWENATVTRGSGVWANTQDVFHYFQTYSGSRRSQPNGSDQYVTFDANSNTIIDDWYGKYD